MFDEKINRRGSGSMKWDHSAEGVLPMWVADMDFKTAPCIIEALRKRVDHGVFGYVDVPAAYYEAIIRWFQRRHDWIIDRNSIIYTIGVVPALSAIIKAMTKEGDGVVVQSPAYNCFYSSIRNNGCNVVYSELIYHPDGYSIDFDRLEGSLSLDDVKVMIVCNPHNPVGRVWTREELKRIGDLCLKHNVFVVSDEIHCELTYQNHDYTAYQSLGAEYAANSAACISPSKAFNIAGLQNAAIVAPDPEIRAKIDKAININEVCDVNPFGVVAVMAAYNEGEGWLDSLRNYLWDNYVCVRDYFSRHLPEYTVLPLQGTYLVWINCEATGVDSDELVRQLVEQEKLQLSPGSMYGKGGDRFLRLNIACPRANIQEALPRLERFLKKWRI